MSLLSGTVQVSAPAYVTVNVTPLPSAPAPLEMPVGLLFEETRVEPGGHPGAPECVIITSAPVCASFCPPLTVV